MLASSSTPTQRPARSSRTGAPAKTRRKQPRSSWRRCRRRSWSSLRCCLSSICRIFARFLELTAKPAIRTGLQPQAIPRRMIRPRSQLRIQILSQLALRRRVQPDLPWFAAWKAHIHGDDRRYPCCSPRPSTATTPSAAKCSHPGRQPSNSHEVGRMGQHVIRALLTANRRDGWELMERTLLAAQRQEGLRQSIWKSSMRPSPKRFAGCCGSSAKMTSRVSARSCARPTSGSASNGIRSAPRS